MATHDLPTARDLKVLRDQSDGAHGNIAHLRLVASSDRDNIGRILLVGGDVVVVGRDLIPPGSKRPLCDDGLMSRRHFVITKVGQTYYLTDADSTNGTFLGGHRLRAHQAVQLAQGSVIRSGNSLFVFNPTEPTMEPWEHPILPGYSPALCRVRDWLQRIVPLSLPVLLLGETGTGKEYVALGIHRASRAANGPFVAVNCGELERSLARSELFGAMRGAYTGAVESRSGLVADAANGTLFLDELGELDLDVQKSLLRFLQDGSYRPVGGNIERRSTARIIAATNADLEFAVRESRFREDLLARLRSLEPICLPPLRNRRDDILRWSEKLLAETQRQMGIVTPKTDDADVCEALLLEPWSRNLRELQETMLTAALRASGSTAIRLHHLPESMQSRFLGRRAQEHSEAARDRTHGAQLPLPSLDAAQRQDWHDITLALARCDGNVSKAAEILGRNRRWLYRRAQSLGIDLAQFRDPGDGTSTSSGDGE